MKESRVFYYGSKMAISILILATISLLLGLILLYFIFRNTSFSFGLIVSFWQVSLLLSIFIFLGIEGIIHACILLHKCKKKRVILRLTVGGIVNYKRNIALQWADIDDIIFISYRNRFGIGVNMKNKSLLFKQLPFYSRFPHWLFGLSVFDAFSGEYIQGDGKEIYQEIKAFFDQVKG